ncbi:MAG: hypothetical protein V1647_07240, partial [Pseudomonadota bacterium]
MPQRNIKLSKSTIAYICFFISGFSALIYETAWLNRIQLVMGFTIYALVTTLCAYLSGLAFGALMVPRIKRSGMDSFWLYVTAEFIIGIYGLLFMTLLQATEVLYNAALLHFNTSLLSLSITQFVFCGLVIVLPTFLMGTTLPLLADAIFKGKNELSIKMPSLYGVNTLGAFFGCILSGYLILPLAGYSSSIVFAAFLNFILVFFALVFFPSEYKFSLSGILRGFIKIFSGSVTKLKKQNDPEGKWSIGFTLFASGFICMLTQILWNRLAGLAYGHSVYIFTLVTGLVLLGIVIGCRITTKFNSDSDLAKTILVFTCFSAAALFYVGTFMFTKTSYVVFFWLTNIKPGFILYNLFGFLWMCVCLLPSMILLGMLFPLSINIMTWNSKTPTDKLSSGYALNIFGLIAGAIFGGFFAVPYLGIEFVWRCITGILVLTFLFVVIEYFRKHTLLAVSAVCFIIAPMIYVMTYYDKQLLTSGFFYNRTPAIGEKARLNAGISSTLNHARLALNREGEMLDYRDDAYASVSIHMNTTAEKFFKINGKIDGSNNEIDIRTVKMLGLLPMLVRPDAESALTIGLGTGLTFSTTLDYP